MLKLRDSMIALALCMLLDASHCLAQGTDTGSGLAQDRREEPTRRALVHVGAGTTSASTTGYSGQKKESPTQAGEIELPPLPDATLCDSYRDKPGYDGCLEIVLPQTARSQQ